MRCLNNNEKDWLMLPLGLPKGAMLSNAAMASTTYAVSIMLNETDFVPEDVNISYLPASHVFERELQVIYIRLFFTPLHFSTFSVGNPKGVMLSTNAMTTTVYAVGYALGPSETFTATDVAISYLPLAHAFERGCQVLLLSFCLFEYLNRTVLARCMRLLVIVSRSF